MDRDLHLVGPVPAKTRDHTGTVDPALFESARRRPRRCPSRSERARAWPLRRCSRHVRQDPPAARPESKDFVQIEHEIIVRRARPVERLAAGECGGRPHGSRRRSPSGSDRLSSERQRSAAVATISTRGSAGRIRQLAIPSPTAPPPYISTRISISFFVLLHGSMPHRVSPGERADS